MTDPLTPPSSQPTPPPAQPTPPPAYSSAPPPPAYTGAPGTGPVPGRTLGIVAFVLSFFVQLVALVLGIVALVQSRKAGVKNGWAVAAIVISAVLMVVGVVVVITVLTFAIPAAEDLARICAELGPGMHTLDSGVTITCG
ncbi:DUF4190 domain-containing protein [Microbacterium aureliae]